MNKLKQMKKNLKFFFPLIIKTQPILLLLLIVESLLGSLNSFLWILVPKEIISELTGDKNTQRLLLLVVILGATSAIINLILNILGNADNYYSRKVDFSIDKMINDKIMCIDYFRLEDPQFKDLVSKAKKGMNEFSSGIYSMVWNVSNFIRNVITISGVIGIVLFSKEFLIVIICIATLISNWLIVSKEKKLDKEFNDGFIRFWRLLYHYNSGIFAFRNQKELRIYNGKKMILDTCDRENKAAFAKYSKHVSKKQVLGACDTFITTMIGKVLTIVLLTYSCYKGNTDLATVTMLYSAVSLLDGHFFNLIFTVKTYSQDCEYQESFIDLMEMKNVFRKGTKKIDKIETIEIKNVSFKYPGQDVYVLKNLNLKINYQEKVSLVGLNGSGKTTLIKLLCRFYPIEEGTILLNGVDIEEFDYDDYISKIAVVFQDFFVISFSIKSNIANCDENQEKLYDCLRRAQALDLVEKLEKKEYTYINKWFDKSGIAFSGGEMQKFAIARALYKDGDFVVLDEPTSALDPMSEAEIYYHFNDIVGKKTTLFISHRLSSCRFSDRILVLDGASIKEEGTHNELMNNTDSLYYKMFTSQAKYYE